VLRVAHRALASLEAIGQVFGEAEIVVARELTKQFEEIVRGTPGTLHARFAAVFSSSARTCRRSWGQILSPDLVSSRRELAPYAEDGHLRGLYFP